MPNKKGLAKNKRFAPRSNHKTVVVTGGAGFIGSYVCDLLIKEGVKVIVFDNLSSGKKEYINKKSDFVKIDITNFKLVNELVSKIKPSCIFHLAALSRIGRSMEDPIGTYKVNVNGTLNMLEASKINFVSRFIFSSSSSIYGSQNTHIMTESLKPNPISHYAIQKMISEMYCSFYSDRFGLETVSLRYFNVYGNRQPSEGKYSLVVGKFLSQLKNDEELTIFGDGTQSRDFTHVEDVATANLMSMNVEMIKKRNLIINIGTARETSINQLARILGGETKFIIPNPNEDFEEVRKVADIKLAKKILGWTPSISIEERIQKLLI